MKLYSKEVSGITYSSELIPHLFSIQVFFIKSLNKIKGAGLNSQTTYGLQPRRIGVICSFKEEEMNMQPLGDRVVIKPLETEGKTKGGIVIPDTAKEKPQEGKVVAVGKGKVLENGSFQPPEVKVGDRVLYARYSGTEVTTKEGEELLILKEEDILAIIK